MDRRKGKPSDRRVPVAMVEEVLRLYLEVYFDLNLRHFHEKLRGEHGIELSYTWVQKALQGAGLVARGRKRRKHQAAERAASEVRADWGTGRESIRMGTKASEEWSRYAVGAPSQRPNWTNQDCDPFDTVFHICHPGPTSAGRSRSCSPTPLYRAGQAVVAFWGEIQQGTEGETHSLPAGVLVTLRPVSRVCPPRDLAPRCVGSHAVGDGGTILGTITRAVSGVSPADFPSIGWTLP